MPWGTSPRPLAHGRQRLPGAAKRRARAQRGFALQREPGHPFTPEQKLHYAHLSRIRIIVENTLAEMKHFRILADVFRHPIETYDSIFVAVAGFVTRRADRRLVTLWLAA